MQMTEHKFAKYENLLENKDTIIKEIEDINNTLKFGIEQLRDENDNLKLKLKLKQFEVYIIY